MRLTTETYGERVQEIKDLFFASFGRHFERRFFEWRYLENPLNEVLAQVEYCDDLMIGNYSASPSKLTNGSNTVKGALSMTTMTHPDHAGKGIFTRLAETLYADMANSDYSLIYGFPNSNSHYAFVNKLGWTDIYEIPTMTRQLGSISRDLQLSRDDTFQLQYPDKTNKENLWRIKKDTAYLSWRYGKNPNNRYQNFVIAQGTEAQSFCVTKIYGQELDIVDLNPDSPDSAKALIEQVLHFAAASGLKQINTWCPRHHFSHAIYEKLGFQNSAPITYFGCRVFGAAGALAELRDFSNWYIQMGDSDVY